MIDIIVAVLPFKILAALPLFINSQTCVEICRRVVVVLCSVKDYLVVLWVQKENSAAIRLFINSQTCLEKLSKSGSRPLQCQRLSRSPLAVAFYNS